MVLTTMKAPPLGDARHRVPVHHFKAVPMPVGSNFAVDIGIHVGKLFEIVSVASLD
jgi:hypothetical protein